MKKNSITVEVTVRGTAAKAWEVWTTPKHIEQWAFASPDWGAEALVNDVRPGGTFKTRMFAKDGSASFFFEGTYTAVEKLRNIEFELTDGRRVSVRFTPGVDAVTITETFDPEDENTEEIQRSGWQAFLENFRKYTEGI